MIVRISALGNIKKYIPQGEKEIEVEQGTTLRKLKGLAGIPENLAVGYVVNGTAVSQDYKVSENDTVLFVMLVGGG